MNIRARVVFGHRSSQHMGFVTALDVPHMESRCSLNHTALNHTKALLADRDQTAALVFSSLTEEESAAMHVDDKHNCC